MQKHQAARMSRRIAVE